MKYFYIIMRSGFMHEIPYSEEKYMTAFEQLSSKGIIATIPKGQLIPVAINSVDVAEVLTETAYESYVRNQRPHEYIKNGTWYDGKQHEVIRHEDWKKCEIEGIVKLQEPRNEIRLSKVALQKKLQEVREKLAISGVIKEKAQQS